MLSIYGTTEHARFFRSWPKVPEVSKLETQKGVGKTLKGSTVYYVPNRIVQYNIHSQFPEFTSTVIWFR